MGTTASIHTTQRGKRGKAHLPHRACLAQQLCGVVVAPGPQPPKAGVRWLRDPHRALGHLHVRNVSSLPSCLSLNRHLVAGAETAQRCIVGAWMATQQSWAPAWDSHRLDAASEVLGISLSDPPSCQHPLTEATRLRSCTQAAIPTAVRHQSACSHASENPGALFGNC